MFGKVQLSLNTKHFLLKLDPNISITGVARQQMFLPLNYILFDCHNTITPFGTLR